MTFPQSAEELVRRLRAGIPMRDGPLGQQPSRLDAEDLMREAATMIETLSRAPSDEELLKTAQLLLQNAEGCAVNHYGHDFETMGCPGWLKDAKAVIEAAALRRVSRPVQEGWRRYAAAKKAADALLAPLTMEVGRLLEEAPDHEIEIIAYGDSIKIKASVFNALYEATDAEVPVSPDTGKEG